MDQPRPPLKTNNLATIHPLTSTTHQPVSMPSSHPNHKGSHLAHSARNKHNSRLDESIYILVKPKTQATALPTHLQSDSKSHGIIMQH
ncbi:hypothetical protein CLU79DRAFT_736227 [Phycomyces nitens]|nr:hypothetical protein CLU79DRAFT_736227 [Phycomyces nitens]